VLGKWGPSPFLVLAGAATVLGFSPFDFLPAALLGYALLIYAWMRAPNWRASALAGFWFGLGLFGAGVSWVYVSIHRFGGMPAPLAAFATLAFCAFLALFPALAGALQARVRSSAATRAVLVIPACWTLIEWIRSWILTGFPWLTAGYAAIDSPLAGFAPIGGVYLLSLATLASAGLLCCVAARQGRWIAAGLFVALGAVGAALKGIAWSEPAGPALTASLLQGNIPQDLKFDPARYARTLDTYARLAEQSRGRLIVLPETAAPRFLDQVEPEFLKKLESIARRNDGDVLLGVPLRTGPRTYFNSVISLGASPLQKYDKTHLVPFGEFIPTGFRWINSILAFPLSDFSRGDPKPAPLRVAGERVAVNICYEDVFGAEIARQLPEATLLVNVSNVAWFGDSLAPRQHLQIARMRTLETGRMLLAATNSGMTAAIATDARVIAELPQFAEGKLEVSAQGYKGVTPYVRFGDWLALGASALLIALAALLARRASSG
jgi:apolipoprotein N-acyltransferase